MRSGITIAGLSVLFLASMVAAQMPQVVVRSHLMTAGEVQRVETVDSTRLYRLTVNVESSKPVIGANVEYEILTASGAALGGGMFTVRPEMLDAHNETLSVLTGFGGLELGAEHAILIKLVPPDSLKRAVGGAGGIVDTCTTYCDRCSEKAGSLCNLGVQTYSCSCSGETRSCNFTCYRGV